MRSWLGIVAGLAAFAHANPMVVESGGKVFPNGANSTEPAYLYHRREESEGQRLRVVAEFKEPAGREVITEELLVENGQVRSYLVEQKQVGEKCRVEVRAGRVYFTTEKDGRTRTGEEALTEDFIVGATIGPFLQSHWTRILKGETIRSRLAVLDRRETIGFKFRLEKEFTRDGISFVRVKMSPTNFVISAIVDPIYLSFRKADGRIVESEGTTLLRSTDGSKSGNLSARVVFD